MSRLDRRQGNVAFFQHGVTKKCLPVAKKRSTLNLHLRARDVELRDPQSPMVCLQLPPGELLMKRLTILTVIAMLTVAANGCAQCRAWFRGDDCTTCGSGAYSAGYGATYGHDYGMYSPDAVYDGAILPPPDVLPEPQSAGQ